MSPCLYMRLACVTTKNLFLTLKYNIALNNVKKMTESFLMDLSQDIGQLFSTGENYDLIIQAGENQNVKEFFAHSLILSARSSYFKTALSREWAKKENGIIIFKKPNISPEIIEIILKYLYTGFINLDKKNGVQMLKLLIASD